MVIQWIQWKYQPYIFRHLGLRITNVSLWLNFFKKAVYKINVNLYKKNIWWGCESQKLLKNLLRMYLYNFGNLEGTKSVIFYSVNICLMLFLIKNRNIPKFEKIGRINSCLIKNNNKYGLSFESCTFFVTILSYICTGLKIVLSFILDFAISRLQEL